MLWRTSKGQLLIPASDMQIISRICIVTHAGSAGHRDTVPITRAIKLRFSFTNMDSIIKHFIRRCNECLKSSSGKRRPLMFGHQVVAERPDGALHMDHLFMQAHSESGDRYLLVVKEGFSSLYELIPSPSTNAASKARSLLRWIIYYSLPSVIVSDWPFHFKKSLIKAITDTLRIRHHTVMSCSPWANEKMSDITVSASRFPNLF